MRMKYPRFLLLVIIPALFSSCELTTNDMNYLMEGVGLLNYGKQTNYGTDYQSKLIEYQLRPHTSEY